MKNMEVTHTLRLYDAEFIAKLGSLMEKEQKHYRNKNEFMTAVLKMGYERYIGAMANQAGKQPYNPAVETSVMDEATLPPPAPETAEDIQSIYPLLSELSQYVEEHYKAITANHTVIQKLLSSIYNIVMSLNDGNRLMPQMVSDGFYDNLPARFENIIVKLETKLGLT